MGVIKEYLINVLNMDFFRILRRIILIPIIFETAESAPCLLFSISQIFAGSLLRIAYIQNILYLTLNIIIFPRVLGCNEFVIFTGFGVNTIFWPIRSKTFLGYTNHIEDTCYSFEKMSLLFQELLCRFF